MLADAQDETGCARVGEPRARFLRLDARGSATWMSTLGCADLLHLDASVATPCGVRSVLGGDEYRRIMSRSVDGVASAVRAAAGVWRGRGGAIVVTASSAGVFGDGSDPFYALTKQAVVDLVHATASDLEPDGITINAVCPAFAAMPLPDGNTLADIGRSSQRLVTPDDVARTVVDVATHPGSGECWTVLPRQAPPALRLNAFLAVGE
jgi:NAD(P)-dependent dehydrogenase (short-subunit alcohol dehydrogenase family)